MKKTSLLSLLSVLLLVSACGRFSPLAQDSLKTGISPSDTDNEVAPEEEDVPVQGVTLSEASLLHKISMAIKGKAPHPEEYEALKLAVAQKNHEEFLSKKTQEYIKTKDFSERMVLKLEELFYLKSAEQRFELVPGSQQTANSASNIQFSATNNVFRDLFEKNLPWDNLITGKSYRLPIYTESNPEERFYRNVLGLSRNFVNSDSVSMLTPTSYKEISFDEGDPRVAGVITSPRFFARYTSTGLNKNRRRAAAIFRIALCDPMVSSIPENHDSKSLKDLIFPEANTLTEEQIRQPMDTLHGTQADCMSCHYKLDPLGQSLRESPLALHDEPSLGALVFTNAKGVVVNKPGRGIGEITKFITEQPEYLSCQVDHFWNWFIGSDISLGKKTRKEVMQVFENVGRKTNDFIAYLISRPEFKIRKSHDPQINRIVGVKSFLKRCDSCHDGMRMTSTTLKMPPFSEWPINGKTDAPVWLNKISKSLDLEHGGKNRTMPTKGGFIPTTEELENLRLWISQGAPNERGQKMETP